MHLNVKALGSINSIHIPAHRHTPKIHFSLAMMAPVVLAIQEAPDRKVT